MKQGISTCMMVSSPVLLLFLVNVSPDAHALPSFARQTGQRCSSCHVGGNWPQLTPWGRLFKLSGYTAGKSLFGDKGIGLNYVPVGPSLTHITSQYPPAQLTALLKAPRANMKAAGMVPLTLNAADMKALVSYLASLGGTSAASTSGVPGSASPAPPKAEPDATAAPSNVSAAAALSASGSTSAAPTEHDATAGSSKLNGEAIFKAHKCDSCHGTNGAGGTAPRIAGQNISYLTNQLLRFRAGDRSSASEMTSAAKQLDREQIRAAAAFLASQ